MIDKNLFKELQPYKHQSSIIAFLDIFYAISIIARCFCLAYIIDKMIFSHFEMETAMPYLTLLFLLFLLEFILDLLIKFFSHKISIKIKNKLRYKCMYKLVHTSPLNDFHKSDTLVLLTDGIGSFDAYFNKFLPAFLTAIILPILIILVSIYNDWISGGIFLATMPLIPFFMVLIGKKTQNENEKQWQLLTTLSNRFIR